MKGSMVQFSPGRLIQLTLFCGVLFGTCRGQGLAVIGQKLIRPGTAYNVVILNTIQQLRTFQLSIKLDGLDNNCHSVIKQHRIVRIQKGKMKSESFQVGNIPDGKYTLTVESLDAVLSFKELVNLEYHNKKESIFIQLDKPLYKPGDIIRFRIIVVDVDIRPATNIKTVDVSLFDAEGNKIMTWSNSILDKGVFESWFQIASSPTHGTWKLVTQAGNSETFKEFEVKPYVLPKFFVKVRPAEEYDTTAKQIKLIVETSFTFGKPVNGNVTVDLFIHEGSRSPKYTITKSIHGLTTVNFDLNENDMKINDNDEDSKNITARISVKESFSNLVETVIVTIPVYRNRYDITMSLSELIFQPGMSFSIQFHIKDRCGESFSRKKSAIILINENRSDETEDELIFEKIPNEEGKIILEFTPSQNATVLMITEVTYDSYKQEEFGSIEASRSKSNHQLKVTYDKDRYNIRPDQTVKFELSYPKKIKELLYIFVSRGRIIDSGYIGSHTTNFRYRLTKRMAPKAKLVVMYLKDYLIYDALDLVFDEFDNKFDFTLDPSPSNAYMPGQEICVEVEAASDSYVALHAIDQSILQLSQTDHLFTRDDLIKELSRYDATDENAFDSFHTMGLFLKTTLKIDSPYGESKLLRFGLMSEKRFEQPIHIRTEFPETWLWSNFSMQGNSKSEITAYMPDTLTSWTITGFALSPTTGLSIIKQPLVAKVNHDFFIVANLPYSIKRDEVVVIQATVFNNLGTGLSVDVKLYSKNDEIQFYNDTLTSSHFKKKTVFVENNSGQSVSFFIKANKLGEILVRLEAVAMFHSDSVEHVLRVIPESLVHRENAVRFIDLSHETVNYTIAINIPRKTDNGSVGIEFSLDPSFLGTTNENLDKLLLMPTGCCEQSMVKFIPDIVILDYLDAIRATNEGIKTKAINFLKEGYQNQLKCKLDNGAFSIFPKTSDNNAEGSVFLTAFIAKSLKIASKHITVDGHTVADAFRWLASQQRSDGKFIDETSIYMAEMQGGIRTTSFALTAYVLAAFLETEGIGQQYPSVVTRSTEYLKSNFDNMDHPYDLAVTSYAMSMSKDSKGPEFLRKLINNSTFDRSNTYRYWNHETLGVEIAGYALLAKLNDRRQLIDSTPIMRWLNSQRSSKGGFVGTQETFVALKALAKFAVEVNPNRNEYRVQVRGGDPKKILKTFKVQRDIIKVLKFDIESSERSVFVEVSGIGTGYFQVFYKYHRSILHEKPSFNLAVNVLKSTTYDHLHLKVCVAFKPKDSISVSNMALVEIALPSGIMATENAVENLSERKDIQKTELRYEGTSIVVYYMNLSVMEKCFNVKAERRYKVAMHRPSYVVAYDYYHKKRVAIQTYEGNVKQPCELCEGEDCDIFSC